MPCFAQSIDVNCSSMPNSASCLVVTNLCEAWESLKMLKVSLSHGGHHPGNIHQLYQLNIIPQYGQESSWNHRPGCQHVGAIWKTVSGCSALAWKKMIKIWAPSDMNGASTYNHEQWWVCNQQSHTTMSIRISATIKMARFTLWEWYLTRVNTMARCRRTLHPSLVIYPHVYVGRCPSSTIVKHDSALLTIIDNPC